MSNRRRLSRLICLLRLPSLPAFRIIFCILLHFRITSIVSLLGLAQQVFDCHIFELVTLLSPSSSMSSF